MRTLTPILLLLSSPLAAQTLDEVFIDPPDPTECQLIDLTFFASLPAGTDVISVVPEQVGNTIQITLFVEGPPGALEPFQYDLPGLGPLTAGDYDLLFILDHNNGLAIDSLNSELTVGPGVSYNAGEDGATQVCNSDGPFLLFDLLGGTPDMGGSWIDPEGNLLAEGAFEPGVSTAGAYTYFFDLEEPCTDDAAQVIVTYLPNSNAGGSSSVTVCSNGPVTDLFLALAGTPDAGGAWTGPFGAPHSGLFNPLTDPCGPYVYVVPGIPPCGDVNASVYVQCEEPPFAGEAMSTIFCQSDTLLLMNDLVFGESEQGYWLSPSGTVVAQYGEVVNIELTGGGIYHYVADGGVCIDDSTDVLVQFSCELDPCLVLDMPMENGDAIDLSTYAHQTFVVSTSSTEDRFGVADGALYFDGEDDQVAVAASSALSFNDEATFSLWYRLDSLPYDVVSQQFLAALMDKSVPGSGDGPQVHLVRNELETEPCEADEARARLLTSPEPVTGNCHANDSWRHLVATFQGGLTNLYVNGVLDASLTVTSPIIQPNAHTLMLGANPLTGAYRFKGAMDDVLIYRCALSAEQVDSLYQGQSTAVPVVALSGSSVGVDPSQHLLHLHTTGPAQLELIDVSGRPVLHSRTSGTDWWWNYSVLPSGVYVLRVQHTGQMETHHLLLP